MEKMSMEIGGRLCYVYRSGPSGSLLVQAVDDHDIEVLDREVEHIERLAGGAGFTLAVFKVNDWNSDLSPWEAPPVFGNESFGSGAEDTLAYITDVLLPELQHDGPVYLGGYSLAGFFALWAAYRTDKFAGTAAASPSVWFPGWIELAETSSVRSPLVYLSLGDKEEKTRNPVMRKVGDNIRRQYELLQYDPGCEDCILEMNQGNHFKEPDLRTAKGFAWLLNR